MIDLFSISKKNYKKGYPPSGLVIAEFQALLKRMIEIGEELGNWKLESPIQTSVSKKEMEEIHDWQDKVYLLVRNKFITHPKQFEKIKN